ncbi:glycine cleavage system protein GcvH [Gorillibacterium massiliense]|uniref:glycine cleavage system protein GcvH n=1 Tax=Gorillibacterium massiliense TaxID=1280390 RepID=UPI0004BC0C83|nr:glycine cleavage system protein GcvH [Gorillibacterium massiliense]
MSEIKAAFKYSEDHEWAETVSDTVVRVGISDFAQNRLGDIVFVELPEVGAAMSAGDGMGTIESVKTVSDLFCPVNGTVIAVNTALIDQPELVNSAPYGEGWLVEVEIGSTAEEAVAHLMNAEQYAAHIETEE